ncbi:hypothetical protein V865_004268 [Kwoniella europaea PYCC6329]|uniref:Enkurin domain-containing protein n=1 Tax=Kwoniella europaea PYCC6329 TaxID=1423913 RepID=A0AAX4KK47_9TREE
MPMSGSVPVHAYRLSLPDGRDVGDTDLESRRLSTKSANPQVVSRPKKKKRSWKRPTQAPNHPTSNLSSTTSTQTPISTADSSLPKLRMDQIIEPPQLSLPGNTASTVKKWDHSLFRDQDSTMRLAYRPFKEVLPKNLPPRPRLPAAFPVQQLPAKIDRVPPTASRSHITLSEFTILPRPEPRTAWQERSVSAPITTMPNGLETEAVIASGHTPSLSRDSGTKIEMLERQVQSLTDRLSNCQNELQEIRVKLDFANMSAGRAGANLGTARKEIKELKERINELEGVSLKIEDEEGIANPSGICRS